MTEGVVKFTLDQHEAPPPDAGDLGELPAWHILCHRLGLIGQHPERYQGLAYGNLSRRLGPDTFVISGSQTGGRERRTPEDYTRVTAWDIERNWIQAYGPCHPSSEALTHAALYERLGSVCCVIHVHAPEIWRSAGPLGLPGTPPGVAYGTPALAREVWRLFDIGALGDRGVFVMGGHTDGVVAYGPDAQVTGLGLVAVLVRALLRT